MSLTGAAVLSVYTMMPSPQFDNPEREAWRHLGKAAYKEFHLDDYAKRLERRYVPPWVRRNGAAIIIVGKLVTEHRIAYAWTF